MFCRTKWYWILDIRFVFFSLSFSFHSLLWQPAEWVNINIAIALDTIHSDDMRIQRKKKSVKMTSFHQMNLCYMKRAAAKQSRSSITIHECKQPTERIPFFIFACKLRISSQSQSSRAMALTHINYFISFVCTFVRYPNTCSAMATARRRTSGNMSKTIIWAPAYCLGIHLFRSKFDICD